MITASLVKELRDKSGAGMLDCKKALEASNGDINAAMDYLREKGIAKAAKKSDRIAAEGIASVLIKGNDAVILEINSETDFVAKNEEFKTLVDTILETLVSSNAKTLDEALELKNGNSTIKELIVSKTATIGEKLSLRRFSKITKKDNESFGSYIHMGGRIAVLTLIEGANEEIAKDVAMHAAAMRPLYLKSSEVPTDVLEKEKTIIREQLINEGKPEDKIENILVGKVRKYYEEVCLEDQIYVKAENKETVSKFVQNNGGKIINMIRYEVGEGMEKKEELCEKNNAQLLLVSMPSPKNWNHKRHAEIQKYADGKGITYLDLNKKGEELGLNWTEDTQDKGDHLNVYGAEKVTSYLGNYLEENYELEDHRNDPTYEAWNQLAEQYKQNLARIKGKIEVAKETGVGK